MKLAASNLVPLTMVLAIASGCGGPGVGSSGSGAGSGNTGTTVTFTFQGQPTAVAARIGSGSFAVQSLASDKLSLTIPSGTTNLAVAWVCPDGSQYVNEVSTADGSSFSALCVGQQAPATGTLTATLDLSTIPGVFQVTINASDGNYDTASNFLSGTAGFGNPFSASAPTGNDRVDLLAYGSQSGSLSLLWAKDFPTQAVPGTLNGGNTIAMGPADATVSQPITYANVPSGFTPTTYVSYNLSSGGSFLVANNAVSQYPALPTAIAKAGDYYEFEATAANGTNSSVSSYAGISSPGPVNLTFPAPWTYSGPTPAALPTFDFSYTGFVGKSSVLHTGSILWPKPNFTHFYLLEITPNALNGSTTATMPDLSGIPGFLAPPTSGQSVSWYADTIQEDTKTGQPIGLGSTSSNVQTYGSLTVP